VVESSETDCVSRFVLEQFQQRESIHFSTFWHTFTSAFHVSFIVLHLLLLFSFCTISPRVCISSFFPLSVASDDCFYLRQVLPCILTIGYCIRLLYIFIISQFTSWFKYCTSTGEILSFNVGKFAVGQAKIVLPMFAVKNFR